MKTASTLTAATAIVAIVTSPFAAAGDAEAEGRNFGDGSLPTFLEPYDLNEDGVLSTEERQAAREASKERREGRRDRIDTDGDGEISDDEKTAARKAARAKIEAIRNERFNRADTDDSGSISLDEFVEIPAIASLLKRRPLQVRRIFNRLDADDDSVVNLEEFLAHLSDKRDRNDGRTPLQKSPGSL